MEKASKGVLLIAVSIVSFFFVAVSSYGTPQGPDHDIRIKVREHTKLQPVVFSHATHVDREKIECATCHHKDPTEPKACTTCHGTGGQGKTPSGKEALHGSCERCHKEQVHWKCHDCHHKP